MLAPRRIGRLGPLTGFDDLSWLAPFYLRLIANDVRPTFLLRLAERKGYGERLIAWLEQAGFADRLAPVYAAFKAYVRGEQLLLDVNPEVRRPAKAIYDRLDAPRRHKRETAPEKAQPKRPRGRPRRKAR